MAAVVKGSPVTLPENWELVKVGATPAKSTWSNHAALKPRDVHDFRLVAAIVRTSVAGITVDPKSAFATDCLGDAVLQYLDFSGTGVFVDSNFSNLKDFIGTTFSGVLGAGLAYLRMHADGYYWKAHYEDAVNPKPPPKTKQPDFVFASSAKLAAVECKGTKDDIAVALDRAKTGFLKQVQPAFKRKLFSGVYPSVGFCFGTALNVRGPKAGGPIEMARVFREQTPTRPPKISSRDDESPKAIASAQAFVAVQRLHYEEALLQAGIRTPEALERAINRPRNWIKNVEGPPSIFRIGEDYWAASVALPTSLIRAIAERRYPTRPEPRRRPEDDGQPAVSVGDRGDVVWVFFGDHTRVVFRKVTLRGR